jgi:hypothetical protein
MLQTHNLLLGIMFAVANVSFGNTATVRPLHEWSYEKGPDYYVLHYYHEAWDNESTGFTIECRAGGKTTLTIGYTVMDDNYFKAYKRKRLKPKIEIRSIKGRLTVDGELEEDGLFPAFVFSIPQSSSTDVLKILSGSDAVMVFPNRSFKLWRIKRSSEIPKFLSACGSEVNQEQPAAQGGFRSDAG